MNILLVEDNQFKIDKILSFLLTEFVISNPVVKKSYNAALNELLSDRQYDLVLLDISIPTFDSRKGGGEFMPLGGKHLFSQMYFNEINSKVIVITMFKNFDDGSEMQSLDYEFRRDYSELYCGYVLYVAHDEQWKLELGNLLNKLK